MTDTQALVLRRTFHKHPATVFEAWRDPLKMARWFSAPGWNAQVSSDFRVGGAYRIEMRGPGGVDHVQFGEYLEIDRDAKLTFTWTCKEIGVIDSVVSVELTGRGDTTEMLLRHTLPADRELVRKHEEGWVRCLDQLKHLLQEAKQGGRT